MLQKLDTAGSKSVFLNTEMRILPVLVNMELNGVQVYPFEREGLIYLIIKKIRLKHSNLQQNSSKNVQIN